MPLSNEDRAQQADARVDQLEQERYGHELNLAALSAVPNKDRDDAWAARSREALDSIAIIDAAISAAKSASKAAAAGKPVVDEAAVESAVEVIETAKAEREAAEADAADAE